MVEGRGRGEGGYILRLYSLEIKNAALVDCVQNILEGQTMR